MLKIDKYHIYQRPDIHVCRGHSALNSKSMSCKSHTVPAYRRYKEYANTQLTKPTCTFFVFMFAIFVFDSMPVKSAYHPPPYHMPTPLFSTSDT